MNKDGFVYITADDIRKFNGRVDLILFVDGTLVDYTLTFTPSNQWQSAYVAWTGPLTAGSHTVVIQSPTPNVWGCGFVGSTWGAINTMILE